MQYCTIEEGYVFLAEPTKEPECSVFVTEFQKPKLKSTIPKKKSTSQKGMIQYVEEAQSILGTILTIWQIVQYFLRINNWWDNLIDGEQKTKEQGTQTTHDDKDVEEARLSEDEII